MNAMNGFLNFGTEFFRRKLFWSKINFRRKKFRRKSFSTKKIFDEKNRCQCKAFNAREKVSELFARLWLSPSRLLSMCPPKKILKQGTKSEWEFGEFLPNSEFWRNFCNDLLNAFFVFILKASITLPDLKTCRIMTCFHE